MAQHLPIDDVLPQLLDALARRNCVVLQAPTGAGKTTRVPPAIWDARLSGGKQVVVLQPRRLAARATAARIAYERNSTLGGEVGYQVRFERRATHATRILVVTEGILVRRLQDDPFLEDVGVVVFDEFHERNLNSELALGMVRKVQQSVRPDLKIVVMSATLDAQPIARFLDDAPVVISEGRLYPVEIEYLPTIDRRPLPELVAEGVRHVLGRTDGDVLAFLPGVSEIRSAQKLLESFARDQDADLLSLYGDLPPAQQDAVLQPGKRRKIVLSTNVAETSVTIEGVTAVVDSGYARVLRFDPDVGIDRLQLEPISRASAAQRAGRAGRLRPGVGLRLWPEVADRGRAEFDEPEIRRLDLAGPLLQLKAWIEPELSEFPWFEAPRPTSVEQALTLLQRLDALVGGHVTELGAAMARLPVHPRVARLLLKGQQLNCLSKAALAAALISERDPFVREANARGADYFARSDIADRVSILEDFAATGNTQTRRGMLHHAGAKSVLRVAEQLKRQVGPEATSRRGEDEDSLLQALLAAYPDRLAKRREPESPRALMVGGKGVVLSPQSVVGRTHELFLCIETSGGQGEALVRQASAIERDWLPESHVTTAVAVEYDEQQDRLQARRRTAWEGLVLEEVTAPLPRDEATTEALAEAAAARWDRVFPPEDEDAAGLITRVRCLGEWMPELGLPALDDARLQALVPTIASGCRSLTELRKKPWLPAIQSLFSYVQLQVVQREAPERIRVPSGNHIRLNYQFGKAPVLAARIQELFGLHDTPRIAGGRVRVLMHLLAPNYRPQQVTEDLRSFWANTYPQVRKDLRARYPKHAWPEDPWTAEAQSRPRRPTR